MQTQRTYLRRFEKADLNDLVIMMSDPELMKFTGFREPQAKEMVSTLLEKWIKSDGVWAAVEKESEELVGWFMLKRTILEGPELGFMLVRSKWGKGFATEVCQALLNHAFNSLKESKVMASADFENKASIKVLEKLGFKQTKSYSNDVATLYFEALK